MSIADVTLLDVLEHELDAELANEVALDPYPGGGWADDWVPTPDPECVAVGCGGCLDELREYPCNCRQCRLDYPETYDDGETTWWRCEFCRALFDLEDMEILSGDSQACEPCVSGWEARERATRSAP